MTSKCTSIFGIVTLYIVVVIGYAIPYYTTGSYLSPDHWLEYSRYNPVQTPRDLPRRVRESSFFPENEKQPKHEESVFRFPSTSLKEETNVSSRSINGNNRWNLPHSFVVDNNESSFGKQSFNPPGLIQPEDVSKLSLRQSPRKSKLTSGFADELISHEIKETTPETLSQTEAGEDQYQLRVINRFQKPEIRGDDDSRGISPEAIAKFTETLGAINTVGRYLVNYTRGGTAQNVYVGGDRFHSPTKLVQTQSEDLPKAIYTISKNVLGRNMTDTIVPIVKPLVTLTSGKVGAQESQNGIYRPCSTPDGSLGNCDDLSDCPQLLLNLSQLRQSICFKSLFVPGVCCPRKSHNEQFSTDRPRPEFGVISQTTVLTTRRPVIALATSTRIPIQLSTKPITSTTTHAPSLISSRDDCGLPQVEKFRVVGGIEALPGRWPWMAAIFLHGSRRTEFWCGGALIGQRHILTAAHCTRDSRQKPFNAHQFTVRLGDIDLKRDDEPSSPETYYVTQVRAHPKFSRVGFYNDIAVLVLDRPVKRSRYIIPLCLPSQSLSNERFIGQKPTVVGWGTTYYGGKESTIQRQVELPVWKNEDCDRTYFQPITENFICAGLKEGGKDACQGDSGGPLMIKNSGRWIQIGIVSFGNKCGEPGYPGVYTRVTQYLDWIQENMI